MAQWVREDPQARLARPVSKARQEPPELQEPPAQPEHPARLVLLARKANKARLD